MNMHWIDWTILSVFAVFILTIAYSTQKYMRSIADFLVANRCAGKYLLGVADGMASLGAISIIAWFEMYHKVGFTGIWWQTIWMTTMVVIAVTGWVQYRYRQTRVMTVAQFFEVRYSRNFRIFAGILTFIAGTLNFAIFPAVGGRFFQYYSSNARGRSAIMSALRGYIPSEIENNHPPRCPVSTQAHPLPGAVVSTLRRRRERVSYSVQLRRRLPDRVSRPKDRRGPYNEGFPG